MERRSCDRCPKFGCRVVEAKGVKGGRELEYMVGRLYQLSAKVAPGGIQRNVDEQTDLGKAINDSTRDRKEREK